MSLHHIFWAIPNIFLTCVNKHCHKIFLGRRPEPLPTGSLNDITSPILGELSNVDAGPPVPIGLKTRESFGIHQMFNIHTVSLSSLELGLFKTILLGIIFMQMMICEAEGN